MPRWPKSYTPKTLPKKLKRVYKAKAKWALKVGPEHIRKFNTDAQRRKRGCEIPNRPEPKVCECCFRPVKLHADHDHATGKFRGWICLKCNTGIGLLGDTLFAVEKALRYLTRVSVPL